MRSRSNKIIPPGRICTSSPSPTSAVFGSSASRSVSCASRGGELREQCELGGGQPGSADVDRRRRRRRTDRVGAVDRHRHQQRDSHPRPGAERSLAFRIRHRGGVLVQCCALLPSLVAVPRIGMRGAKSRLVQPHRYGRRRPVFRDGGVLAAAPGVSVAGASLFLGGMFQALFAVMQTTLAYRSAPVEMRARLLGVLSVCIGSGPIGFLYLGYLAEVFTPRTATMALAAQGMLVLLVTRRYWIGTLRL